MSERLSRRRFLQVTSGAGAFASIGAPVRRAEHGEVAQDPPGGWFDQPMRWVQLTLVENDPGRFDPAFWLDYFRRLHADAATLSAGGIVAYYPTEVPLHHRSAWLGDSDPFGTLVAMILRETSWLGVIGVIAGCALSAATIQLITSRLYGLSARDPLTFVGAIAGLIVVATLAAWLPAHRASRIDPLVALRYE
jgi:hypothetical protein